MITKASQMHEFLGGNLYLGSSEAIPDMKVGRISLTQDGDLVTSQ